MERREAVGRGSLGWILAFAGMTGDSTARAFEPHALPIVHTGVGASRSSGFKSWSAGRTLQLKRSGVFEWKR